MASPFFRSNTDDFKLTTYGVFGEAYFKFNDKLKLSVGLRYNNDEKSVRARTTLLNWSAPTGVADATTSPFISTASPFFGTFDADPGRAGAQLWQEREVSFGEWTGRAVVDYQVTPDNLVYASYSRGYKSGGINPPLSVGTTVEAFEPEFVNAFEIGSKNSFANGKVVLNLTGFYYDYKGLQLSRIVNRTSQNANVDAKIYGLEAEAILRPTPELTLNLNASYLHTEVTNTPVAIADTRDPGGGRSDAVIIKDATNAANCAVGSNTGNATAINAFVNAVNAVLGFGPTQSFGSGSGIASNGAYSICAQLAGVIANPTGTIGTLINASGNFGVVNGTLPFTYYANGVPKSIIGNELPGAPDYKFAAGVQYAIPVGEMTVTPRADFIYTGQSYGNVFNGKVNEVPSFTQVNAQLQIDGPDKKWFARLWVQNLTNNSAITGLYVTDQSSGLYTNIFTLEPRRYGLTAGIKF
jgi:outer membrane receptor protein involved in Fe transport